MMSFVKWCQKWDNNIEALFCFLFQNSRESTSTSSIYSKNGSLPNGTSLQDSLSNLLDVTYTGNARKMDKICRVAFPVAYVLFVAFYFLFYSFWPYFPVVEYGNMSDQ